MHNVINLILLDDLLIALAISHIKLLIPARQRHLLVTHIGSDHIVLAYHIAQCLYKRHSDLSLAASHQNSSPFLYRLTVSSQVLS
jgi:hypothetical protein